MKRNCKEIGVYLKESLALGTIYRLKGLLYYLLRTRCKTLVLSINAEKACLQGLSIDSCEQ
jgi:hypothetical protein